MIPEPAVYAGTLRHRRFRPRAHELTMPLFMFFLDIDRIPELFRVSRLLGHNHFNWATFDDRDHIGDPALPLRLRLSMEAEKESIPFPDGPVYLLTHLRYLGFNFNPVSFFYCYSTAGELELIVAEVHNTFREVHSYWLSRERRHPGRALRYRFPKAFHVSPFLSMNCEYDFTFTAPGESLVVQTNETEGSERTFDSTLRLRRRPWSAQAIRQQLLRHPFMTGSVIAGIHWHALRLYFKGVPVVPHPGGDRFRRIHPKHSWRNRH